MAQDGSFTYKNIPLLDYTGTAASNIGWNFAPTGLETESSTGIEWSLIPDGEEYVAVFRRADGLSDDFMALMPRQTNNENAKAYFAHLPIHEAWGCLTSAASGSGYAINSPRLPAAEVAKIKTVILDYGINGHEAAGLANLLSVTTVVYPNGYTNVTAYCFNGSKNLKNVIWANDDIPHMEDVHGISADEGLLDMRGMKQLRTQRFFYNCTSAVNVVFGSLSDTEAKIDSLFMGLSALKRAWMTNASRNDGIEKAPDANVIDMRGATNVASLDGGAFEMGATVRSIYLPVTVTKMKEATGYGNNMALGNGRSYKFYTESAGFKAVLQAYYTHVTTQFTGSAAQALDKITVNDKSLTDYLAS